MYDALGHTLVLCLGKDSPAPTGGTDHLSGLYEAAVKKGLLPKSSKVSQEVDRLQTLRTSYLSLSVIHWATRPKALPRVFEESVSIILTLSDSLEGEQRISIVEGAWRLRQKLRSLRPKGWRYR